MMKRMWENDLSQKDCKQINTRTVKQRGLELPNQFIGDACYACPSNRERNTISAGNFCQRILDTHPLYDTDESPPEHTIVVKAEICSANNELKGMPIDTVLRHNIITTCGDDSVKYGT